MSHCDQRICNNAFCLPSKQFYCLYPFGVIKIHGTIILVNVFEMEMAMF